MCACLKIGLVICVDKESQAGASCYNTSEFSSVQQQEYNWAKQSVFATSINTNVPSYSTIPEDLRYFPQRVVSELAGKVVKHTQ